MQSVWRFSDRTTVTYDEGAITVEGSSFFAEWLRLELGPAETDAFHTDMPSDVFGAWLVARAQDTGLRLLGADSAPDSLAWLAARPRRPRAAAAR